MKIYFRPLAGFRWFISLLILSFGPLNCLSGQYCHHIYENKIQLDNVDDFADVMCTNCLKYIHSRYFPFYWKQLDDWKFYPLNAEVFIPGKNNSIYYELSFKELKQKRFKIDQDAILSQFADEEFIDGFLQCCQDAYNCCKKQLSFNDSLVPKGGCSMYWDGWSCWDPSEANHINYQICPDISVMALGNVPDCARSTASKHCYPNGTWDGRTNFDECDRVAIKVRQSINRATLITEIVSIIFLSIGMFLFLFFNHHNKFRVRLHLNFFLSIMLSSIMALLYAIYMTRDHLEHKQNFVSKNSNVCRTFTFLYKGTRLINYGWMLIEGFFFHNIVVFSFNKMSQWSWVIYGMGWSVPSIVMLVYMIVRMKVLNDFCWTDQMDDYEWIYLSFPYAFFIINLLLFINLVRVILVKLVFGKVRYSNFAKRGFKTALFLIPVFGLQYFVYFVPIDPTETCDPFLLFLIHLQVVIEGIQGTIATIVLCFLDKDIFNSIRKTLPYKVKRERTITTLTTMDSSKSSISS